MINMLKKNIEKNKRKERKNTFVGCRPARFKNKRAYTRKGRNSKKDGE